MENNPFKKIAYPPHEVPKELKSKVMDEVARLKLLMELTDLFAVNYPSTARTLLNRKNNKQ